MAERCATGIPPASVRHDRGLPARWEPLRVTGLDGTFTESLEPFEIPWVFFQGKGVTTRKRASVSRNGTPS